MEESITAEVTPQSDTVKRNDPVKLRRSVGLRDAVAVLVSGIIGAGIFISPRGVLLNSGSVGLSLTVWALSGLLSMCAALCYAELGTRVRESGGDWAYLRVGLGAAPAFIYAWLSLIANSSSIALVSTVSGEYLLNPFFDSCGMPVSVTLYFCISLLLWES